ncbi:MAG: uracil phosphoribosyltransferase [Planctomycetes bacterium]|nr:uracil phosphoribosyltransferase [Planctomycetota bacterium]NOG53673.1 uracil phosphoribosyltransferase [Planctomycetota bacterium]
MESHPQNLVVLSHPLIRIKMTELRDHRTRHGRFRSLLSEIAGLMVYECTRDLDTHPVTVQTPLESCDGCRLTAPITVIPILRAGLGMTNGILNLMPEARVGHIGLYRDDETLDVHQYYAKFPPSAPEGRVFLVDPMLATGASAVAAVNLLQEAGCRDIKLICLVAAPEGVQAMIDAHPETMIYTAALDRGLNELGYILPGLGDAGDRIFGTV